MVSKSIYLTFTIIFSHISRKKNLFFLIVCFFSIELESSLLHAQNLTVSGVRIWDIEIGDFTTPKDLVIRNGKVFSIRNSSSEPIRSLFALPGFCDAYTTLGVNPWGGSASPDSLKIGLQGFLSAGFTHIDSVGDGDWIAKVQGYISKNQWKGPIISRSRTPLISHPGFEVSNKLYHSVQSDEEMRRFMLAKTDLRTHIFHRNLGNYIPDLRFLYSLTKSLDKEKKWIIHTFADPESSKDALGAGWNIVFHPISFDAPKFQMERIHWAPLMAVYYYQSKRNSQDWEIERLNGFESSPFFKLFYEEVSKSFGEQITEEEKTIAKALNSEYDSQFRSRFYMKGRLLFASGTGYPLVYPGLGGIKESEIWEDNIASWEEVERGSKMDTQIVDKPGFIERFYRALGWRLAPRQIQSPSSDPKKIPDYRKILVKALTEDTCSFLGSGHGGRIREGDESSILFYDENPLTRSMGIHKPISVYIQGKLSFGKKL